MPSRPQALSRLLSGGRHATDTEPNLARILERAKALQRIGEQVAAILPAPLAAHVRVANLREDRLVMSADSAAWGTRLRYFRSAILERLTTGDLALRHLDISVSPRQREPRELRHPQPISAGVGRVLAATAEQIDDAALADALRRLARHAQTDGETL